MLLSVINVYIFEDLDKYIYWHRRKFDNVSSFLNGLGLHSLIEWKNLTFLGEPSLLSITFIRFHVHILFVMTLLIPYQLCVIWNYKYQNIHKIVIYIHVVKKKLYSRSLKSKIIHLRTMPTSYMIIIVAWQVS